MVLNIFGGRKNLSFERKIIIITSFIISTTALVAFFTNILLGLNSLIIFASAIGFVIYTLMYFLALFTEKEESLKWIMSIMSIVFLNIVWFLNYMSNGPANYIFLILVAFIIFIWDQKRAIIFSAILAVNIFGLILFEILFPESIEEYPSQFAKTLDVYVGLIICATIIFSYTLAAKKNYLKQYFKAKRADHLKSAFLANMTHEIRTPLNSILGFTDLLIENNLTEDKKKRFSDIVRINTLYLASLIDDILDTSKIESNQLSLHFSSCSLAPLFERLKEEFQRELDTIEKEVKIKYELPASFLSLHTDGKRLEQILRNLISNSMKFTEFGSINFGCYEENNGITFYVKDTGNGIKEEHIEKIFDRFSKNLGSENTENLYRGTGIGLSLSKELVELLEGKMWVESEFRKGSSFYFHIPRVPKNFSLN